MSKKLNSTPKKDGFRMPGEFEQHEGCWMIWPERTDNWRLGAKPAQNAFAEIASAIAEFEPVTMSVSNEQFSNARQMLPDYIRVVEMANNDSWMRDVGPTFLVNDKGEVRAVDWEFNSWGGLVDGLYFPWDQDDKIAQKVCEIENINNYRTDGFILEGGSIHVDGEGTCIVTVDEKEERLAAFIPDYVITKSLMENAAPGAILLHCLPANDKEEVTREALEGTNSVALDQAENRLTAQMAILVYFTQKFNNSPSEETLAHHKNKIDGFLNNL